MKFEKYLILIFFGVLILFAAALYSIYHDTKEQRIQELNTSQMILAQQASEGIKDYIGTVVNTANFLARFPDIVNMTDQGKQTLINYQSLYPDEIMTITRVNAQGQIIYTYPFKGSIGQDISYQDHIQLSMKTHKTVISDVFTAVQGYKTVAVHVPVFKDGKYDGTLALLLSFDRIAKKYIENIKVQKSGYAWVVSEKGIEISSPFVNHIGKNIYVTYKNFPEIISMADEMLHRKSGTMVYHYKTLQDTSNEKIVYHAIYLPIDFGSTFWAMVIATPEDEALESLSVFKTHLAVITIALLIVCIACLYLVVKYRIGTG